MAEDLFKTKKCVWFDDKKKKKGKKKEKVYEFKPKESLKNAKGLVITAGGLVVGTKLLKEIGNL